MKLQEKEEQINQLINKQEKFEQLIQSLIDNGQFSPIGKKKRIKKH